MQIEGIPTDSNCHRFQFSITCFHRYKGAGSTNSSTPPHYHPYRLAIILYITIYYGLVSAIRYNGLQPTVLTVLIIK